MSDHGSEPAAPHPYNVPWAWFIGQPWLFYEDYAIFAAYIFSSDMLAEIAP
jgi:hypothetical protein